jgi:hypothetical protein
VLWDGISEPEGSLKPEICAAGLTVFLDTNVIGDDSEAMVFLWRCRREGWIRIQRTDILETEFLELPPELEALRLQAALLAEVLTPFVAGHSRLDVSVVASEVDRARIERAFRILHPRADLETTKKNNVRDAMTVAGVARYGGDFLATRDRGILRHRSSICEELQVVCDEPEAIERSVRRRICDIARNRPRTGWPKWIPAWVPGSFE